ncbi:unnamed protein product, partial [Amoebophrya sp. A25]
STAVGCLGGEVHWRSTRACSFSRGLKTSSLGSGSAPKARTKSMLQQERSGTPSRMTSIEGASSSKKWRHSRTGSRTLSNECQISSNFMTTTSNTTNSTPTVGRVESGAAIVARAAEGWARSAAARDSTTPTPRKNLPENQESWTHGDVEFQDLRAHGHVDNIDVVDHDSDTQHARSRALPLAQQHLTHQNKQNEWHQLTPILQK